MAHATTAGYVGRGALWMEDDTCSAAAGELSRPAHRIVRATIPEGPRPTSLR